MSKITYIVYHGTDCISAKKIMQTNFIYKRRSNHWLGNGIYFFEDYKQAKWWSEIISKKQKLLAVIIEVKLEVESDKILDLRETSAMLMFLDRANRILEGISKNDKEPISTDKHKLMCIVCDYYKIEYNIDLIIKNFSKDYKSSFLNLDTTKKNVMQLLGLNYQEVQYCVSSNQIIKNKKIIYEDGDDMYV